MPSAEEQETKTIEFSTLGNRNEVTSNTPVTIKDDSQAKRTSSTERFAALVGLRSRDKKEMTTGLTKAITTEAGEGGKQRTEKTPGH